MKRKLIFGAMMVCFLVLGLSLIGCPNEPSDDDGDDDYKTGDIVINKLRPTSYGDTYEVELLIYGYSTIEGGRDYVWKDDFNLYLNDEEIELSFVHDSYIREISYEDYAVMTFFDLRFETPTITAGENYKVKVVYTASPERPLYEAGISTRETFESFEIEKNITAE